MAAVPDPRRILVITSYGEGAAWNELIEHGIKAGLGQSGLRLDVNYEHLDARRFPDTRHAEVFAQYIHDKFTDSPPELILAADDPAVRLVLRYRGTLLPEVPVVFCGVNEYHGTSNYVTEHREQRPWLTGVLEPIDIAGTVDLALTLHPGAREIVLVGEADAPSASSDVAGRDTGLKVRVIPALQLPLAESGRQLQDLPDNAVVLFWPFHRDGMGQSLTTRESANFVASHSRVPVYTINRTSLGYGPIGGRMADPYTQGRLAAEMANAILRGTPPSVLPIESNAANLFEFDYGELRRWHIPESALPAGSIIVNRPRTFRETHPLLIASLVTFLCVQMAVIGVLLVQRKRRRLAEDALRKHSQQLANSNYMLEQFAYITAHDFQEPIRSVALFAELLERGPVKQLDAEGQQAIQFIYDNSRRLHAMVRGLLAWVRSVDSPPDSELWCDANHVWREVLDLHRDLLGRNAIVVKSGNLPSIAVHAHHMRELLNHLLANALQHSQVSELTITIRADRAENAWKLTLFNSGQSIPETQRGRVFGVFRRLQGAHRTESVGMGLAISRRIVDFYGGRIWIEAGVRHGCAVSFTVPDTPRQRARRPQRMFLQSILFSSSHAHTDHRG